MVEWFIYCGGSKMRVWNILRGDVLISNIGTPEQRSELLKQALAAKENNPSMGYTNEGCWRGEVRYEKSEWLMEELHNVVSNCVNFYLQEDQSYKNRFKPHEQPYIESWTNINDPKSRNIVHAHKSFDYVALYYIQAKDTGGLVFHNPANLLSDCNPNSPYVTKMIFEPQDGDLLVWPAWIPHEVYVNESNLQRVNIAFNIRL